MTQLTRRNVLLLAVIMAAATTVVAYLFLTRQQVQALDKENKGATQTMVVVARQEIRPLQLLRGIRELPSAPRGSLEDDDGARFLCCRT